jgi:hypothetical protein
MPSMHVMSEHRQAISAAMLLLSPSTNTLGAIVLELSLASGVMTWHLLSNEAFVYSIQAVNLVFLMTPCSNCSIADNIVGDHN